MGDGSDEDGRPAKRIRLGRPDDTSQQQDTTVTDIPGLDFTAPTDDLSYGWSMGLSPPVFDADWRWATSATSLPMADSLLAMESLQSNDVWPTDETAVPCLLDERSMSGKLNFVDVPPLLRCYPLVKPLCLVLKSLDISLFPPHYILFPHSQQMPLQQATSH